MPVREVEVLVVRVADERVGLPLDGVIEVLPAVALAPLPDAPPMVCGVVNLHGSPLPVLSLRERLGLGQEPPSPEHHIVVCDIAGRSVGVWVDGAEDVMPVSADALIPASDIVAARHLAGVAVQPDGVLLVYDARSFLGVEEALDLEIAMAGVAADSDLPS